MAIRQKLSTVIIIQLLVLFMLAITLPADYVYAIPVALLLLPFLDKNFSPRLIELNKYGLLLISLIVIATVILCLLKPDYINFYATTLLLAALPEEWFFRNYLQRKMGNNVTSILVSSMLFSILHSLTRGPVIGLLVIAPSLIYGFIYKKTNNLILTILCHALGNLIAVTYLNGVLQDFIQ